MEDIITMEDIKTIIRRSKKKISGSTRINKEMQAICRDKSLEQQKNIFSAGHFPNIFKEAIIKFIPKKR